MDPVDQRARDVARAQRGLATRGQLVQVASVSRATITRRLSTGRWSEPMPGVIDLGSHQPSSRRQLQQLLLAAGPAAWASHLSAAHLHRFLDVPEPARPHLLVRRGVRTRVPGAVLHSTRAITPDEVTVVAGVPSTGPARTLLDLAPWTAAEDLERYAGDLGRRDLPALRHLGVLLDRYPFAHGRRRLIAALSRLPDEVSRLGSPLEVVGISTLLAAGAPRPVLQFHVPDVSGAIVKRVDAAWPDARTVLEFDGAAYHDTTLAKEHDGEVRARMRALGWTVEVLRRSDLDGRRPTEIAERLQELLGA